MNNVMLDLETLSTRPNAAIVAIGAVKFSGILPGEERLLGECFYRPIIFSSIDDRFHVDPATVAWWFQQSDEARHITQDVHAMPLGEALIDFRNFIGTDARIWGNGAGFDNVILENAYRLRGVVVPWRHYNNRCYRTMKSLADVPVRRIGTHHHALDDARTQANHLLDILSALRS